MAAVPLEQALAALPPAFSQTIWHGRQMGPATAAVIASGYDALDRELPGGGWPCGGLTELLQSLPCACEFQLLGPALADIVRRGGTILLVSPPHPPHVPGLHQRGLDARHLVWIEADTAAERLWVTEQAIRSVPRGTVLAWLPQAHPEQIRRLQTHAQQCMEPVFLLRPAAAQEEASAAPLRVQVDATAACRLHVRILKRRGPLHDGTIELTAHTPSLERVLSHRRRRGPSPQDMTDVVLAGAHSISVAQGA